MQRQPNSVFTVADAYHNELLADAARTRRKMPTAAAGTRRARMRSAVGLRLVGAGARLLAAS